MIVYVVWYTYIMDIEKGAKQENPKPSRYGALLKRYLMILAVSGMVVYGGIYHVSNGNVPLFVAKVVDAIEGGTLSDELSEWFASRGEHDSEIEMGERLPVPDTFMNEYSPIIDLYQVGYSNNIAFTEIREVDIFARHQSGSYVTIPLPQHDREDNGYMLYARVSNGEEVVESGGARSSDYGGVIVEDGRLRVGFPNDFTGTDEHTPFEQAIPGVNADAVISYFAVVDSRTADRDLGELNNIRGVAGKRVANSPEFSSMIVTYYLQDGSFVTVIGSSFRQPDYETGEFNPRFVDDYTIPQLYSLAEQYGNLRFRDDLSRVIVAFPDPGPSMSMIRSTPIDLSELHASEYEPFLFPGQEGRNRWYQTYGGNASAAGRLVSSMPRKPFTIGILPE